MTQLRTRWLGRLPYEEAWDLQRAFHEGKVRGRTHDDYLFLLEHPPVFTIGRNGSIDNLLVGQTGAVDKGAEVHHIDRGGDITFHGPWSVGGLPAADPRRSQTDRPLCAQDRGGLDPHGCRVRG